MTADAMDGATPAAAAGWLLALHSSAEGFGVGLLPWPGAAQAAPRPEQGPAGSGEGGVADAGGASWPGSDAFRSPDAAASLTAVAALAEADPLLAQARLEHFPTGRDLSNRLLLCLDSVLPAREWPRLRRLAVATGPGGFTSTRLTVVLARTLAQQDQLPLDGVSSFRLIARRLLQADPQLAAPFWLVQDLPRRGRVAGLYGPDASLPGGVAELEAPRLRAAEEQLTGLVLPAEPRLPEDVAQLLAISVAGARLGLSAPWQAVVPIYPTSPVQES